MIRQRNRSAGTTMLELLAATTILSIALVPALKLTRNGLLNIEVLERSELSVALATSKMEEELARTVAAWDLSPQSGHFASIGRSELLFRVVKSDAKTDGGVPGSLAVIDVVVWHDSNGNATQDAEEAKTRLTMKLAKMLSYEHESQSH